MDSREISWVLASSPLVPIMTPRLGVCSDSAINLALRFTIGVRVSSEEEAVGLDYYEHGEPAYEL